MSSGSDETAGLTPPAAKLQRILGPSPAPRMLTPSEIELLRKSKREMAEVVGAVLATRKDPSQSAVATEAHKPVVQEQLARGGGSQDERQREHSRGILQGLGPAFGG